MKVRWRTWNPISLLLCRMFNEQCPRLLWHWEWSAYCLYEVHKFFCPDLHEEIPKRSKGERRRRDV